MSRTPKFFDEVLTVLPREQIPTYTPEVDVWNEISKFENAFFVRDFLKERIADDLHGLQIQKLNAVKQAFNQQAKKDGCKVQVFEPLKNADITDELLSEITNSARQANDFYNSAKELPLLSRPILLHYAYEKLASILVLSTYNVRATMERRHGLEFTQSANVKLRGLFPTFHDCFSINPSVYTEQRSFTLENLLAAYHNRITELITYVHSDNLRDEAIDIPLGQSGNKVKISEMDRELLFVFILSNLARYRVNKWSEILEGKDSNIIIQIRTLLDATQTSFPIMILSLLKGKLMIFSHIM